MIEQEKKTKGVLEIVRKIVSFIVYAFGIVCIIVLALFLISSLIPDGHGCGRGENESCRASLRGVQSALELFYTHYKYYPENTQIMIVEGYLQENGDKDTWGNAYKYERSSDKSNYKIGSAGEDKKFGTDDDIEPPINTKRHTFKIAGSDADLTGESNEIQIK